MPRSSPYLDFLRDPDQNARRAELLAFIGPNADGFLQTYDGLQARAVRRPGEKVTVKRRAGFVAMAFFLGPCWFFYRRMWVWGWSLLALLVVIELAPLPRNVGLPVGVLLAIFARQAYLQYAIGRIAKLRTGDLLADLAPIAGAGGVSKSAGWISGMLFGLLTVAAIAAIILAAGGSPSLLPTR